MSDGTVAIDVGTCRAGHFDHFIIHVDVFLRRLLFARTSTMSRCTQWSALSLQSHAHKSPVNVGFENGRTNSSVSPLSSFESLCLECFGCCRIMAEEKGS